MAIPEKPLPYLDTIRESLLQREALRDVRGWYEGQLTKLPEITVTEADLTDGEKWVATLTEKGRVQNIAGAFFVLRGCKIAKYNPDGSPAGEPWTQPGLLQNETALTIPTPDGLREVQASGFVGIIKDIEGRVLLTLAQEPFAETPKNALLRTPLQTSATKFQGLLAGNREVDPNMYDTLQAIGGGQNISSMLADGTIDAFPLSYADANRIRATNIGFVMHVDDTTLHIALENNGQNRWFTQEEVNYAVRAGLLNGHTGNAILGASVS